MSEDHNPFNAFNYLIDSFWASLPEKTADDIADFKKDVLKGIRSTVDRLVDEELAWTDRHLENARRMRREYEHKHAPHTPPSAPPNPAY